MTTKSPTIDGVHVPDLQGILSAPDEEMTPEVARYLLKVAISDDVKDRVDALCDKARSGTLTASERDEANNYNQITYVLAMLKSVARRRLKSLGLRTA